MGKKIRISVGDISADAVVEETETGKAIISALPIEGRCNTWGDEIYFSIPVKVGQEPDAKEVVEMGDLGYWPPGSAFCIFFGPTPASTPGEIRPASAVNVFGRVEGDPTVFKRVGSGAKIIIEEG